jgi:alpha-1,2-mannosyltransferase
LLTASTNSSTWLTSRRLRAHAAILAVCLWSLYLWNLATPGLRGRSGNLKGTDFLHFYTLGTLAAAHRRADLYDMNAQAVVAAERVPQAAGLRYLPLYPPQVSILFAPLAHLPYAGALALWWALSAAIYATCVFTVWRTCVHLRGDGVAVLLLAVGFPAFFHLIAWGQTSALALACFSGAFLLLRTKREFLAGVVLGCLIFKPQLGLAAALVFVAIGTWRLIAGAILSGCAQLAIGILYYGFVPFRQWLVTMWNVRAVLSWLEPRLYQTHCLRTFWSMLIPSATILSGKIVFVLYVISALAVLWFTISTWRRGRTPLSLRYSSLLFATVLISPHLTVYDLVILAPAFLLAADWLVGEASDSSTWSLGSLLYLVYMLPLLGPVTRWTHVQLSVIAMAACVYCTWRMSGHFYAARATTFSAEKARV